MEMGYLVISFIDGCDRDLNHIDAGSCAEKKLIHFIFIAFAFHRKEFGNQAAVKGSEAGLGIADMNAGEDLKDLFGQLIAIAAAGGNAFFMEIPDPEHQHLMVVMRCWPSPSQVTTTPSRIF